eukprot:Nitzschia sp. Nitz4//scaffold34_size148208//39845//40561//NITZ4_002970-RA/size148208-processed-gene-0.36-mRNA-1//-1//CDS//3329548765//3431//frame0
MIVPLLKRILTFFQYFFQLLNTFIDVTNSNDLILSLGLYVIYPAILYLLIDKFHGVCGPETFLKKAEAIAACNAVFLPFTTLLRTSKLLHIVLFSVDADQKSGSQRSLQVDDDDDDDDDEPVRRRAPTSSGGSGGVGPIGGLLGKLKCQTWMHLSQELMVIGFVAFLLLVCLPVLAFWVMLIQSMVSCCSLYSLLKRIWKDSQEGLDDRDVGGVENEEGEEDIEFQEFLSNFHEDEEE